MATFDLTKKWNNEDLEQRRERRKEHKIDRITCRIAHPFSLQTAFSSLHCVHIAIRTPQLSRAVELSGREGRRSPKGRCRGIQGGGAVRFLQTKANGARKRWWATPLGKAAGKMQTASGWRTCHEA